MNVNSSTDPATIAAVLVDLDDTLYEHAQFVRGAYRDVAAAFAARTGLSPASFRGDALAAYTRGGNRDNRIFRRLLEARQCHTPALERALVDTYRAHQPGPLTPFPGVPEALAQARQAGIKLALLTDGQVPVQQRKLDALGLRDAFDALVFTGALGPGNTKPAPAAFAAALKTLHVRTRETAMLGDDPDTDIAGAHAAGLLALRVRTGFHAHRPAPGADAEWASFPEAMQWLIHQARRPST